ncbi:MAG: DUF3375 domain-containing protein [Spirochaetia bacterium]|jgi:flagellar motility protein MotE (MotC chaperone)|nr:DUF3375 domain-containing protein [Spirochaetia bacterium]
MVLDFFDLKNMRKTHPAWRLMAAENGPLVAGFLDSVFRENNLRRIEESELTMRLEDYLYRLSESGADQEFPRSAGEYLDEWARNDRGWLRKFYPHDSDEPHYDLTPSTEKALQWLESLFEKTFIGTESRLFASFDLLRQIVHGVEKDKDLRIKELKRKRTEISQQIKEIESGEIPMLDGREIRERFIQFSRTSRELLGDFRAVEHNFRELDHSVREQIASWTGEKGELLGAIFGKQDSITQSEQGLSFRAFWDFLMSSGSQDELSMLLDKIFELEELKDLTQDNRLRRIHFDWINAGEQTQRMVARLSRQLRRYLDDRSYYENKRIVSLLDNIDQNALTVRESSPQGVFFNIDGFRPNLQVPMERPLYSIPVKVELDSLIIEGEDTVIDTSVLYNQIVVDKLRLQRNIKKELADQSQVSLGNLLLKHPLEEGLAELITYFTIAEESSYAVIDDQIIEKVFWIDHIGRERSAKVPKILFQRKLKDDK